MSNYDFYPQLVETLTSEMSTLVDNNNKIKAKDFKALLQLLLASYTEVNKCSYFKALDALKSEYSEYLTFNGPNGDITLKKSYKVNYNVITPNKNIEEETKEKVKCPLRVKELRLFLVRLNNLANTERNQSNRDILVRKASSELGISSVELSSLITFFKLTDCRFDGLKLYQWKTLKQSIEEYLKTKKEETKQEVEIPQQQPAVIVTPPAPIVEKAKETLPALAPFYGTKISREECWKYIEAFFNSMRENGKINDKKDLSNWNSFFHDLTPQNVVMLFGLHTQILIANNKFLCGNQNAFDLFIKRRDFLKNNNSGEKSKVTSYSPVTTIVTKTEETTVVSTSVKKEEITTVVSQQTSTPFEKFMLTNFKTHESSKIVEVKVIEKASGTKNTITIDVEVALTGEEIASRIELLHKYNSRATAGSTSSLKDGKIHIVFKRISYSMNDYESMFYESCYS